MGVQSALQQYRALIIKDNAENWLLPPGPATGLPQPPDLVVELVTSEQLNPWFTSLWTLQEMCLCPGMWFADKSFNPLFIAENASHPLSLLDVQAVTGTKFGKDSVLPKHALDVGYRFQDAFYNFNAEWNPMTIINMGNQRYCEARRAEAIMSVTGATIWFTTSISRGRDPEDQTIGDKYPLSFISEIRSKYGSGMFFSAAPMKSKAIKQAIYQDKPVASLGFIGSMLPFGDDPLVIPSSDSDFVKLDDDPSTANWAIRLDGKVTINEAFVHLGHSEEPVESNVECRALVLADEGIVPRQISGNIKQLQEWIQNFKSTSKNYAISVRSNDAHSEGLLLKELNPKLLLVVGKFVLTRKRGVTWPGGRQRVDWTVL